MTCSTVNPPLQRQRDQDPLTGFRLGSLGPVKGSLQKLRAASIGVSGPVLLGRAPKIFVLAWPARYEC